MTAEEKALIWLCSLSGLEYRDRVALLLAAKKDPLRLLEEWEKFSSLLIKTGKSGLYMKERSARLRQADAFAEELERKGRFAVTPMSEDYPRKEFADFSDPPLALFGEGNRSLMRTRKFCVVGSRITPPWAEKKGREIASALSERFTIVTGLAEGGDCAAIAGALPSGKLVCVLPTGLDNCYPAAHAALKAKIGRSGLLLSEYPPGEGAKRHSFRARNRILAGLSEGVLVVSAAERSGTLITANAAFDHDREVFALPHNVGASHGEGCNELIKRGARLTTNAEDVLSVYGFHAPRRDTAELSPQEAAVLGVLRESGELHVTAIAERAGIKIYEASAVLSSLEIKNLAVKSGGNQYSAV